MAAHEAPSAPPVLDTEPLVDLTLVRDLLRFVRNACLRHKKLVLALPLGFLALGVVSQLILPKKYYTEAKLLADRNVVMPLLGNPGRKMSDEADTPTRLAPDMITTRENLEKIVVGADLIRAQERNRAPLQRLKAVVREKFMTPRTPQEKIDDMVWSLRTSMNVRVADGTIIIGSMWGDPAGALAIVEQAQRLFLQDRQEQEISLITGSIGILEQRAVNVQKEISAMLDTLSRQRVQLTPEELRVLPSFGGGRAPGVNTELLTAQSRLETAARALADLEQLHSRRLAELQAQLAEQRNVYGPAHPLVETTELALRSAQVEPPQLVQARATEAAAREAVARLGGAAEAAGSGPSLEQSYAAAALRNLATTRIDSVVQERQAYGKSRLHIALDSYRGLLERLDAARIELQTVRATFQYKYGVLIPAARPRAPVGINPLFVVVGALVIGVFLAVFAAVVLDLASGTVLEPFQIDRTLRLPVLGEATA